MSDEPTPAPSGKTSPKPGNRMAGGAPIALLTLVGVIAGGLMGQPSIGLLVGLGTGVLIAIAIWRMGPR